MTEDDILLLANIAGGFNYNRVGVPYSDRFPANVKWSNADALNLLVERLTAVPPAPTGAFVGEVTGAPIVFGTYPGVVYTARAATDGNFTWSIESGNEPLWASLDPGFVNDEALTRYGSGTTTNLPVKQGQTIYMRQDGTQPKNARCSMG